MFSTACSHNLILSTTLSLWPWVKMQIDHHNRLQKIHQSICQSSIHITSLMNKTLRKSSPWNSNSSPTERELSTFFSLERWPYAWRCYFLFQQFTLSCKSLKCKLRSWFNEANRTTSSPISRDDILRPQNPTSSTSWLHLKMMNRTGDRRQSWWSPVPLGMSLTYC